MNQIFVFQMGAVESKISRIELVNPGLAVELYSLLLDADKIEIVTEAANLKQKAVDATIEVADVITGRGGPCYQLTVYYDKASDASLIAKERIDEVVEQFRDQLMGRVAVDFGVPHQLLRSYEIESVNVATKKRMGAYIISRILPLMIIIMAAMGTLYPAIDVIVGERERKTLETTLLLPISKTSIVVGKFVAVVFAGIFAVVLNIVSLALTAEHTLFLLGGASSASFTIPWRAYPVILVTIIIMAAGFSAVTILIASYAKTFREGQSLVTPFFVISFQPAVVAAFPSIKLTTFMCFVPIANASLMFRSILEGEFAWTKIALVLGSLTLYCVIALGLAARRFTNEDTLWGEKLTGEHLKPKKRGLGLSWRRR